MKALCCIFVKIFFCTLIEILSTGLSKSLSHKTNNKVIKYCRSMSLTVNECVVFQYFSSKIFLI